MTTLLLIKKDKHNFRLTRKAFIQSTIILFALFIGLNSSKAQQVSPFQTGHNSVCFINVRDMAKMSPGLFIISYNYFAKSNSYRDYNGDKHSEISLPSLNSELAVDIGVFATVPAFFWGSSKEILGGATFVAGIVPNYMWANVNARFSHTGGVGDSSFTALSEQKLNGFGDLFITPFGLSYGWKHADFTVNYGFTAPTGRYEVNADDNVGLGFWTHQVQAYGYYYPIEDQSTALMAGLTYEMNGKIKGEDFNPGNRLSLEYGISQYLSDRLEISAMGGSNWQVVDDKGKDAGLNASIHDRVSTLAFSAAYWAVKDRLYISAKYMFDFGGVQRFSVNGGIISLVFVPNLMDGHRRK